MSSPEIYVPQPVRYPKSPPSKMEGSHTDSAPAAIDYPGADDDGDSDSDASFVVEKVVESRGDGEYREFLIKWRGYSEDENSWEPLSGVGHIVAVQQYLEKCGREKEKQQREERERKAAKERKRERRRLEDEKNQKQNRMLIRLGSLPEPRPDSSSKNGLSKPKFVGSRGASEIESVFSKIPILDIREKTLKREKELAKLKVDVATSQVKPVKIAAKPEVGRKSSFFSSSSDEEEKERERHKERTKKRKSGMKKEKTAENISSERNPRRKDDDFEEERIIEREKSRGSGEMIRESADREVSPEIPVRVLFKRHPLKGVVSVPRQRPEVDSIITFASPTGQSPVIPRVFLPGQQPKPADMPDISEVEKRKRKEERRQLREQEREEQARKEKEERRRERKEEKRRRAKEEERKKQSAAESRSKADQLSNSESESGSDAAPEYEVERCYDVKGETPNRKFHIQWAGYSDSEDDTWEPEFNVGHLKVVQEFLQRKKDKEDDEREGKVKNRKETFSVPRKHIGKTIEQLDRKRELSTFDKRKSGSSSLLTKHLSRKDLVAAGKKATGSGLFFQQPAASRFVIPKKKPEPPKKKPIIVPQPATDFSHLDAVFNNNIDWSEKKKKEDAERPKSVTPPPPAPRLPEKPTSNLCNWENNVIDDYIRSVRNTGPPSPFIPRPEVKEKRVLRNVVPSGPSVGELEEIKTIADDELRNRIAKYANLPPKDVSDDLIVRRGFSDPYLFRMVMATSIPPPDPPEVPAPIQNICSKLIESVPVDPHRFDAYRKRMEHNLKVGNKSCFDDPGLVTRWDSQFERTFKHIVTAEARMPRNQKRKQEVIASSLQYFDVLLDMHESYFRFHEPGQRMRCWNDGLSPVFEIRLMIKTGLKNVEVEEHRRETSKSRYATKEVQPARRVRHPSPRTRYR